MRPLKPVPEGLLHIAVRQEGLVSLKQCKLFGVDHRRAARLVEHKIWRFEGVTVFDTDPTSPSDRVRSDYFSHIRRRSGFKGVLVFPGSAAVGASALALHGVAGLPRSITPEVALPGGPHHRARDGVVVRQFKDFQTVPVGPWRIAGLESALAQALPSLTRGQAVAVMSDAARQRWIDDAGLARVARNVRAGRGSATIQGWFALVNENDESPAETDARLSFIDHGVPPDLSQVVFRRNGYWLARCDFAWQLRDGRWLVVEIDGVGPHSTPEALIRDAPRQNRLLETGRILLLRYRPADNATPGGIGAQVSAKLRTLGWHPRHHPPPSSPVDL
ncbi:hypothetical protein [Myceligenerans indicum]|uniref:DUF559 domain-containing protein n=1 Tax=Myceligenerans indicum TaxID=2593663 RepID=A0ABS1LRU0_9MICO|nr:hypothetical protein [Myceligenerans indicum]MBL0888944.1 hypothetical protein [Myceligenerans indicum]